MAKYFFEPRKIKEIRLSKSLTFKDIKKAVGLHHKSQMEQWENGEITPKADKIAILASVFDVPPCSFYLKDQKCECEKEEEDNDNPYRI